MAVRLPVLMVHSPPASATAQQMAEAVVGELIGRPGIDMVLIGSTEHLADDSTDRVTLESLSGDTAVLDWRTADEIVDGLHRNGLQGVRAPHADDRQASAVASNQRKIYAFDLRSFKNATDVAAAVMQLNQARQIRTFAIPLPSSTGPRKATEVSERPSRGGGDLPIARVPNQGSPSPPQKEDDASPSTSRSANSVREPAANSRSVDKLSADDRALDLDDLLDQLDQSDP